MSDENIQVLFEPQNQAKANPKNQSDRSEK